MSAGWSHLEHDQAAQVAVNEAAFADVAGEQSELGDSQGI